jgi:hypothetical protein
MPGERTPPPPGFTPREPYDESETSTLYIPFPQHIHRPETEYDTVIVRVPDKLVPPRPTSPGVGPEVSMEQRGEGDRCPTCLAGVDQALAMMRNEPDAVVAVGRLSWCR